MKVYSSEINEEKVMPIRLEKGCYTKISHLSKEDQKRVLKYYKSFGVGYKSAYINDDHFLEMPYHHHGYKSLSYCLSWTCTGILIILNEEEAKFYVGLAAKHIPAKDILLQGQYEESPLSLLTQIRQAKLECDKAEGHLQYLLDKAYEELDDCGISFDIKL